MNNIILLGDPHIGKSSALGKNSVGATLNSRVADQIGLLDWTLEKAIEHNSSVIIVTGDIYEEPNPHPSLITLFVSWVKKCEINGINVHIIRGNHDILRSGSVYVSPLDIISEADLDGISVHKDIGTIIIGTCSFTFIPFRDRKAFSVGSNAEAVSLLRDSLVYELASIPQTYTKVVVGHLAIEGSIPVGDEIDDLANELFCPLDMFEGYDYVWMGHVHKPQVMKQSNPYMAHIGSMDISNFAENDHKKHIIIFDSENNSFIKEDLPTRPLQKISISVPKGTDDTTNYVLEEIKKFKIKNNAIVRVEVALTVPELKSINKSIIDKYLISNGAFNVNGITESKKTVLIKKDSNNSIDNKMDTAAAIKTYAELYIDLLHKDRYIETSIEILNFLKAEGKE